MSRVSVGPEGRYLKESPAKHSENRLKFCGHWAGISCVASTLEIAASCLSLNPRVIWAMISSALGEPAPLVSSAQTNFREPSKSFRKSRTATGSAIPNWAPQNEYQQTTEKERTPHVVPLDEELLHNRKENSVPNGENETSDDVQLFYSGQVGASDREND